MKSKWIVASALTVYLGAAAAAGPVGAPAAGPVTGPVTGVPGPNRGMDATPSTMAIMSEQQKMAFQIEALQQKMAGQNEALNKKIAELELLIQQKDRLLTANLGSFKATYDKHTHNYHYTQPKWNDKGVIVGGEWIYTDSDKPK